MFSEMHYNKIQIYVIKIFEMTHPPIIQKRKRYGALNIKSNLYLKVMFRNATPRIKHFIIYIRIRIQFNNNYHLIY